MLMDRIIGALTFRSKVYADVEKDSSFTTTAWILVAVVGFLNQLGAYAQANVGKWILSALLGTVGILIGFAVGAWVISWVGRTVFKADVTFEEMVRALGLAYVWNVVAVIGVLAGFSVTLSCILAPILLIAAILGLIAWFVAAKEALDLEWVQTIITVILGWIALMVIGFLVGLVLGALGLGASAVGRVL